MVERDMNIAPQFGGMTEPKRQWLKSLNLPPGRDVLDCDPFSWHVQFADGDTCQACQIFTRVMGYFQPTFMWNPGKQSEHAERLHFREDISQ